MTDQQTGLPIWVKVLIGFALVFVGLIILAFLAGLLLPTTPGA